MLIFRSEYERLLVLIYDAASCCLDKVIKIKRERHEATVSLKVSSRKLDAVSAQSPHCGGFKELVFNTHLNRAACGLQVSAAAVI